jgi:hypothetical protein
MSGIKHNKKGVSQVIAIVLFILMSLSAIGILFGAVNNFLGKAENQLAPTFSCPILQANPSKIISADYNENQLLVEVKRAFNEEVSFFDFILETNSGNTERFTCSSGPQCNNCFIQNIGQEKTFYFSLPEVKKVTLYANGNCIMDEKEVL